MTSTFGSSRSFPVLGFTVVVCLTLTAVSASAQPRADAAERMLRAQPPMELPSSASAAWIQQRLPQGDSISDGELARRIARLYTRQAEILNAGAEGDAERLETLLEGTMRDLRQLSLRPGVTSETRFREVYRSILSEYERHHGPQPELAIEQGDIYELREAMFAALDHLHDPLLEDVNLPSSAMATFPMTLNRAVENQIRFYLRNNRHVATVRQRAETYFPMIEQVLAEEGVPDELKYLAVIESALNPVARSWAGAAGMWQFMPATGRAMGLRVTRELDDRLDPELATRAAARHLLELYEMFGDWQLAIAGYNCNPAVIRRAVARAEQRLGRKATFWDIWEVIPRETRGYIPSFIAVSLLFSNEQAFNLPTQRHGPRYEFDAVPVRGGTSLAELARRAGTDVRTLQALNPSLRQASVPQWADGFEIRIPGGHYTRYRHELASVVRTMPGRAPRMVSYHGQNRRVIAFAETLPPGQQPTGASDGVVPVQQVATQIRNGQSAATPTQTARTAQRTPAPQAQRVVYTVRRGDTLSQIARRHGVTINQLRQWNNIRGTTIRIGQRLTIHRPPSRPA
jgi:membrane-bound lytic murein transglycosylase D